MSKRLIRIAAVVVLKVFALTQAAPAAPVPGCTASASSSYLRAIRDTDRRDTTLAAELGGGPDDAEAATDKTSGDTAGRRPLVELLDSGEDEPGAAPRSTAHDSTIAPTGETTTVDTADRPYAALPESVVNSLIVFEEAIGATVVCGPIREEYFEQRNGLHLRYKMHAASWKRNCDVEWRFLVTPAGDVFYVADADSVFYPTSAYPEIQEYILDDSIVRDYYQHHRIMSIVRNEFPDLRFKDYPGCVNALREFISKIPDVERIGHTGLVDLGDNPTVSEVHAALSNARRWKSAQENKALVAEVREALNAIIYDAGNSLGFNAGENRLLFNSAGRVIRIFLKDGYDALSPENWVVLREFISAFNRSVRRSKSAATDAAGQVRQNEHEDDDVRTMAVGEANKPDYAGELKAAVIEDLLSCLDETERMSFVRGEVTQDTKDKISVRMKALRRAIENELLHRVLSVLANTQRIKAGLAPVGEPSHFAKYRDIFGDPHLMPHYMDRGSPSALRIQLEGDPLEPPVAAGTQSKFKELIARIVTAAKDSDSALIPYLTNKLRVTLDDKGNANTSYSALEVTVAVTRICKALGQKEAAELAKWANSVSDLVVDDIVEEIRGNLFYEVPLLVEDFGSLKEQMQENIRQWAPEIDAKAGVFSDVRFVPTSPENRGKYVSVNFKRSRLAGSKWAVDKSALNVMEHCAHYLTCLEILYPGRAEEIFKNFLRVELARVKVGAFVINNLVFPSSGAAISEDEAFSKATQVSYIGLVMGGGDYREALAQSIWFLELFAHPERGLRKGVTAEELEGIIESFLYGRDEIDYSRDGLVVVTEPARLPYVAHSILQGLQGLQGLISRVGDFDRQMRAKLTARVEELAGVYEKEMALSSGPESAGARADGAANVWPPVVSRDAPAVCP